MLTAYLLGLLTLPALCVAAVAWLLWSHERADAVRAQRERHRRWREADDAAGVPSRVRADVADLIAERRARAVRR